MERQAAPLSGPARCRASMTRLVREISLMSVLVVTAVAARAQEATPDPLPAEKKQEERSTGLPSAIEWKFNFEAGWGTFGFANSLYHNPKDPGVPENLSDQWFEGFVKPALAGSYRLPSSSEIYG